MLGKLGVVSDFSELPIERIYQVLSGLPGIENGEAITKRFYLELIKSSRTILDKELQCDSYKLFVQSGKVLCNTGYQNIQDSWYLDGGSICAKIADTYNLIKIAKRQNSGKIKRLLGIKKLLVKGEVIGTPEIHGENKKFQHDFKNYKLTAFCYRIDNSTKGEAKKFADLEIILCTELSAKYTENVIKLDDYDFVLKDSKIFYLKVPKDLKTLEEMKVNVKFAAAVASVLCSFIDVTESFSAFRELYGSNDQSRRELIRQEFEDDEILDRAKRALNYSEGAKEEFIRIVSECTGYETKETEEYAKDIDFSDISAIYNAKPIISCFKQVGIDVKEYNKESSSTQIDLHDYHKAELVNLYPKYENKYKIHHYRRLKPKGLEEKKKLVNLFLEYEGIQVEITNTIFYNHEKELGNRLALDEDAKHIDLVSLYTKNLTIWKNDFQESPYVEEFLNKPSNMSCVYYGELDELTSNYNEFVALKISDEEEIESGVDVIQPRIIYPDTSPIFPKASSAGKESVRSTGFTAPKNSEKIGAKGERMVYDKLGKQHPSIKWVSENAKKANVNPEGRAGQGYDMEYTDENGRRIYIEVKTSTSKTNKIDFYMSENEFNFAQKNPLNYKIYFVKEVKSKSPTICVLECLFHDNDFNDKNYTLHTKKEYRITAHLSPEEFNQ